MDKNRLRMTMLFDFFGDLLTEKQREYYDLYHNEDLSLSEIAEKAGITKQGVYDIVARAERSLEEMERRIGVLGKWEETREGLAMAWFLANELLRLTGDEGEAADIARKLIKILEELGSQSIS